MIMPSPEAALGGNDCALLSAHKNEGPFLLEFVAHHLSLGFSSIFIVTNPSDDGTVELAEALAAGNFIKHMHVITPEGKKPQHHAYLMAREGFNLDGFKYLLILDADELLNIHGGDGTIGSFLSRFSEDVDIISINTACFGNFPHSSWSADWSSARFVYRLPSNHWRSGVSKCLIRNPGNFRRLHPHGPRGFKLRRPLQIAFHGGLSTVEVEHENEALYNLLRRPGSFDGVHGIAQINHYIIRTWDAFQIRAARGRGAFPLNGPNHRHTKEYFREFSCARNRDQTIARYRSTTGELRQALLSVRDIEYCYHRALKLFLGKIASLDQPGSVGA